MKPMRTILVIAAVLLALPFWGVLLANWPLRWISQLQPDSTALNTLLAPLSLSGFLSLMALAHPTRYVVLSAMAILAALAALIALVAAHGARVWRRPAAYLCLAALLAVLVFPWTRAAYQPAIATRPGVELRLVNRPTGLIATAVRSLQIGAEVRPEVYEPPRRADAVQIPPTPTRAPVAALCFEPRVRHYEEHKGCCAEVAGLVYNRQGQPFGPRGAVVHIEGPPATDRYVRDFGVDAGGGYAITALSVNKYTIWLRGPNIRSRQYAVEYNDLAKIRVIVDFYQVACW